MPEMHVKDAGVWKLAKPYVKDAGVWKEVLNGYVKDAGVWKEFFAAVVVAFSNQSISSVAAAAQTASYTITSLGVAKKFTTVGGTVVLENGIVPGTEAPNYEVYATVTFGALTSGPTAVWTALSSDVTWSCVASTPGIKEANISLQFRKIGTTDVLDTAAISLYAEYVM